MSVFEGSEKRLEIYFNSPIATKPGLLGSERGLRNVPRSRIDSMLKSACCTAISFLCNDVFDSYVLSESSLFVYPDCWVLKTCGETQLLAAVKDMLEIGQELNMDVKFVKYSRASFLFPKDQPEPYGDFEKETQLLDSHFKNAPRGSAYILGDRSQGLQWHIYTLQLSLQPCPPLLSLEICMTGLNPSNAALFVKSNNSAELTAREVTYRSGIAGLLPNAEFDDFLFTPCGYSMNGLKHSGFITVHVTPEESCSYASVEFYGFKKNDVEIGRAIALAAQIFSPKEMYISVRQGLSQKNKIKNEDWHYVSNFKTMGITTQVMSNGEEVTFCHLSKTIVSHAEIEKKQFGVYVKQEDLGEYQISSSLLSGGCCDALIQRFSVESLENFASLEEYIQVKIAELILEDTFYVFDLGTVFNLYKEWHRLFPRIEPFYAVKCNPNPAIISLLAALGSGFDCASAEEIRLVLNLGVNPSKIILANPCKRPRDLRAAQDLGVSLTTFDTASEIYKITKGHPGCRTLLRIRADDPDARCLLGNKYGAEMEDVPWLLKLARDAGLEVIGTSFHVGSEARNPKAFLYGIGLAKAVFDIGTDLGFKMTVLDVGGGFSGGHFTESGGVDLGLVPEVVREGLDKYFPESSGVRVIAEPGRYFVEYAATLVANIFGTRDSFRPTGERNRDYWITDGLYGSFNCIPYDHATVCPKPLKLAAAREKKQEYMSKQVWESGSELDEESDSCSKIGSVQTVLETMSVSSGNYENIKDEEKCFLSTVFGPTCDGLDAVVKNYPLPELDVGDWLVFPQMGAYTIAGASDFNGIKATEVDIFYVWSQGCLKQKLSY